MMDKSEQLDFRLKNLNDWHIIHSLLFGSNIPQEKEWNDVSEIITVLQVLGKYPLAQHTYLPGGGGLNLQGGKRSNEPQCMELEFTVPAIIKPLSLIFNGFSKNERWNYFFLTSDQMTSSKSNDEELNVNNPFYKEELVEINPGSYINREYWDSKQYNEQILPKGSRLVSRYFKGGSFVFFCES